MSEIAVKAPPKRLSYCFDIEVYYNFFCATFLHVNSKKKHVFIIFSDPRSSQYDRNDLTAMCKFIEYEIRTGIGYNNFNYDDVILKYLFFNQEGFKHESPKAICAGCKGLSDKIIHRKRGTKAKMDPYVQSLQQKKLHSSLDLLQIFNTVDRVGLKQIAINLKWPLIQDLPFKPSHIVMQEEIEQLLFYNLNDCEITKALLHKRSEELEFRVELTREFGFDLTSASDTMIGKTILRKFYQQHMKLKYDDFKDKRTHHPFIKLKNCVSPKIKFLTPEYMTILNAIKGTTINPNVKSDNKKKKQFEFIHKSKLYEHTIGLGGIHSISYPEIITSDEQYDYWDIDVVSYYPRIIVNDRIYPKHLGKEFVDIYKTEVVERRVTAKRDKRKTMANGLKISANATFGLTKSGYSWLYDPEVATTICVCGELYLLMLMERIEYYTDCCVVYANTDGMTVRVPKGSEEIFRSICQQWMNYTGFDLEFVRFKKMIIYDVSNFLMITDNSEEPVKLKGKFQIKPKITQTVQFPVIAKALHEYFVNGTMPEYYIKTQTDPYLFMRSQRTSEEKYDIFFMKLTDPDTKIPQQKSNRWMVTKGHPDEGKLMKQSLTRLKEDKDGNLVDDNREENYQAGRYVTMMNDMRKYSGDIATFKIDYDFYIQQTYDIVRKMRPRKEKKLKKHELQNKLF